MSDIMTENPGTTVSKLAPHRYVPYHFKGLKPSDAEVIDIERHAQVQAKKKLNKDIKGEEAAWAAQNLANTQELLNNDIVLQNKKDELVKDIRDAALAEKVEKDARWPNMYGDLDPNAVVEHDMVANAAPREIK